MAPINIVLRADGSIVELPAAPSLDEVERLIGADVLCGFATHDGRYVYVDDSGHEKGSPRNEAVTALYHAICKPGTTHYIVGDAVVVAKGGPA